jgi:glycosylphosphatidylinositol transamidase (GPIT) subunit GPI8
VRASANPAKAKGTAWESALVGYLREHHNPGAHRNVQMGSRDIGDVDGYYLHALEAKAEKAITLADYIAQANREAIHAGMPFGCAVVKRRMKGVQDGYVVRDVRTDVRLLNRMRDMEAALQGENSALYEALDKQHREAA